MERTKTAPQTIACTLHVARAGAQRIHGFAGQEADIFEQIATLIEVIKKSQKDVTG